MLSAKLDKLYALDDRQALAQAVAAQLAPPPIWPQVQARLACDAGRIEYNESLLRKAGRLADPVDEALRNQVQWLRKAFCLAFCEAALGMLAWARRLQLADREKEWDPGLWVAAARELGCEDQLVSLVIRDAHALSWPAWMKALSGGSDWPAQWAGWEHALSSSPVLAIRWLDLVLANSVDSPPATALRRLSFCRGRIWQRMHAARKTGRPVETLEKIDRRLEKAGALRDLSCVDYSLLLQDAAGGLLPAAQARKSLKEFWASCPEQSSAWLAVRDNPEPSLPPMSSANARRRGLAWLSWLASEGLCSADALRCVIGAWEGLLGEGEGQWKKVMDPPPARRQVKERTQSDSKKPPRKKVPSPPRVAVVPRATRPASPAAKTADPIPRFPRR